MSVSSDWVGIQPTPDSPYYPYPKVIASASLSQAEEIPYRLTQYLMDLPSRGYTPPSDNRYPRARLKKLLYWDGAKPLSQPLPTPQQMKSIQFDPTAPASPPDTERGYRIFSQELVGQAQDKTQIVLRIYLGSTQRIQMRNTWVYRMTVVYCVMCHYDIECNMQTVGNSRSFAVVQAILEATEGVNFGGIGSMATFQITKFDDERVNTGYKIYQYIDWSGEDESAAYTGD